MGTWMAKNYGWIIVVVLLVLVMVIAIYLKGRKDGSDGFLCNLLDIGCPGDYDTKDGSANPGSANVPDAPGGSVGGGDAVPGGTIPPNLVSMANRLSQLLNQNMNAADRCKAYKEAVNLSDGDFISMANYYKNSNNSTLQSDIMATYTWCSTSWLGGYTKDWSEEILNRIYALGIP